MKKTGLLAGLIALTFIVGCESDCCEFTYSKYYIENYVARLRHPSYLHPFRKDSEFPYTKEFTIKVRN